VPNVFVQEKMNESSVFNVLDDRRTKDTPQTKPIKGGFCIEKNGKFLYATTPQTILMHNSVNDEFQRPTQEEGGIYARHAIKAGTIFKGEIRFRNFFGEQPDFSKLKGKVRIGTSKKDDYGLAKIEFGEVRNFERQSTEKNGEITVYLASDVMLRNENLRQSNLAEDLAAAIGLDKNTEITFQNIQVRRIESWQVSWGFPRPTLTLMQAGSVVRFKTNKKIDIATSEAEGIGERRGEGYGKIIFNPKFLEIQKPVWEKKNADKLVISDAGAEIEDKEFAKLIEKIAWQRELKLAVSKIAAEDAQKSDYNAQIFGFKGLTMSQIGGLRSVIMRLQSKSDIPIVENWLSHLEKTANRLDSWGKGRIEKIKNLLKDNAIWETLGENFRTPSPIAEGSNLKDELWAEAMKSLFYACQLAHKRELEKGGKS
jgi:CRISPR-associated protein Csx10